MVGGGESPYNGLYILLLLLADLMIWIFLIFFFFLPAHSSHNPLASRLGFFLTKTYYIHLLCIYICICNTLSNLVNKIYYYLFVIVVYHISTTNTYIHWLVGRKRYNPPLKPCKLSALLSTLWIFPTSHFLTTPLFRLSPPSKILIDDDDDEAAQTMILWGNNVAAVIDLGTKDSPTFMVS